MPQSTPQTSLMAIFTRDAQPMTRTLILGAAGVPARTFNNT